MDTPRGTATRDGARYRNEGRQVRHMKETRRAFQTTEFWVMVAAIAAVLVAGYVDNDHLDTDRIWTLVSGIAAAYMISRGLSKAGSRDSIEYIDSGEYRD